MYISKRGWKGEGEEKREGSRRNREGRYRLQRDGRECLISSQTEGGGSRLRSIHEVTELIKGIHGALVAPHSLIRPCLDVEHEVWNNVVAISAILILMISSYSGYILESCYRGQTWGPFNYIMMRDGVVVITV